MKKIEFKVYINNPEHNNEIIFNNQISYKQAENYFNLILLENKINENDILNELISKINNNQLIYPGEIHFYENSKSIFTGCCFCFNDINQTYNDICLSKDTWLGHDPDVGLKYENDKIILISDTGAMDDDKIEIEYQKEEFIDSYNEANYYLINFIDTVLHNFLKDNYCKIADILCNNFKQKLL